MRMLRVCLTAAVVVAVCGPTGVTASRQAYTENSTFPGDWIKEQAAAGLFVGSVGFVDGLWVVVADSLPTTAPKEQVWLLSTSFPSSWVESKYKAGYILSTVAAGAGQWAAVMALMPTQPHQLYTLNATIPHDWIQNGYTDGAVITAVAYSATAKQWCTVMTAVDPADGVQQQWWSNAFFPSSDIQSGYAAGKIITALTYGDGLYMVVMTVPSHSPSATQRFMYNVPSWPANFVGQRWPKPFSVPGAGMYITAVGSGGSDGTVNVVMTQMAAVPDTFDARSHWKSSLTVFDQGKCGSCWAWATSESLADRLFVSGATTPEVELSPQPLISCDNSTSDGCDGGYERSSYTYLEQHGTTTCADACTAGCQPYESYECDEGKDTNHDGCTTCNEDTCADGSAWPATYKAKSHQHFDTSVEAITTELLTNGPVSTCFTVYHNFYTFFQQYPAGVYNVSGSSLVGGHCVEIIGYGTQDDMPYWMVRNSWAPSWGDNGYFRIKRGVNLVNFEEGVVAGYPSAEVPVDPPLTGAWRDSRPQPTDDPVVPRYSGGLWQPRDPSHSDVADVLAAGVRLGVLDAEETCTKVLSQVVSGIRYRVTTSAGRTLQVHVPAVRMGVDSEFEWSAL